MTEAGQYDDDNLRQSDDVQLQAVVQQGQLEPPLDLDVTQLSSGFTDQCKGPIQLNDHQEQSLEEKQIKSKEDSDRLQSCPDQRRDNRQLKEVPKEGHQKQLSSGDHHQQQPQHLQQQPQQHQQQQQHGEQLQDELLKGEEPQEEKQLQRPFVEKKQQGPTKIIKPF